MTVLKLKKNHQYQKAYFQVCITGLTVSYCIKQPVYEHWTSAKHLYEKNIQVSSETIISDHFQQQLLLTITFISPEAVALL